MLDGVQCPDLSKKGFWLLPKATQVQHTLCPELKNIFSSELNNQNLRNKHHWPHVLASEVVPLKCELELHL